jgi:hypothetical protein
MGERDGGQTVLTQMTADLDSLFARMSSAERQNDIARHSNLIRFSREFADSQARVLSHQADQKSEPPPAIDQAWTPPQTVKQANQQFQHFPEYAKTKDGAIDILSRELLEVNTRMITVLDEIYGQGSEDKPP